MVAGSTPARPTIKTMTYGQTATEYCLPNPRLSTEIAGFVAGMSAKEHFLDQTAVYRETPSYLTGVILLARLKRWLTYCIQR